MNGGGPAFPTSSKLPNGNGMSLRDWFAGKALAVVQQNLSDQWRDTTYDKLAEIAYKIADALLVERVKPCASVGAPGTKQLQ
jgi:hypothetical protein